MVLAVWMAVSPLLGRISAVGAVPDRRDQQAGRRAGVPVRFHVACAGLAGRIRVPVCLHAHCAPAVRGEGSADPHADVLRAAGPAALYVVVFRPDPGVSHAHRFGRPAAEKRSQLRYVYCNGNAGKWFPALLLPAVFRTWPLKKVLRTALMIEGAELESAVDFIPTDTDLADVAMRKGYVVGHASSAGGTRQDGGFWGLRISLVSTNFHTQDDREHKYLDQIQNL